MKVMLELQDQPSNIKKVTIRHDIVIGRGSECNLRLSAPQVSRRHSFLRIGNDSATITDLDSSNGTYLNGKRLASGKRYRLEDGCRLAIGPVQFVARIHSEVPAGNLLQVNDERIESDSEALPTIPVGAGTAAVSDQDATISDAYPTDDSDSMNFAIESGGPAAKEDDPTADYVAADSMVDSDYFGDIDAPADVLPEEAIAAAPADEAVEVVDEMDVVDVVDEADLIEVSDEVLEVVDEVDEVVEVVDEVEAIDEVDVVEVADDEIIEIADDDVAIPAEEEVLEIQDGDLLVVDEDNFSEAIEAAAEETDAGDKVEDDLRNFLKCLD